MEHTLNRYAKTVLTLKGLCYVGLMFSIKVLSPFNPVLYPVLLNMVVAVMMEEVSGRLFYYNPNCSVSTSDEWKYKQDAHSGGSWCNPMGTVAPPVISSGFLLLLLYRPQAVSSY